MVWGKVILKSNGLSYMDFKVHVNVNKAIDGVLNERSVKTKTVGACLQVRQDNVSGLFEGS